MLGHRYRPRSPSITLQNASSLAGLSPNGDVLTLLSIPDEWQLRFVYTSTHAVWLDAA